MKQIAMVGNTHFDPVWLWQWDEALSSILATFRSALDRMKEDPSFVYSFSAPAVLEQVRQCNPAMFEEIRERVKEGRWELAEGWWLQADCLAACGESYVRQGLYAQHYLEKHFSKRSKTVFNIDSFGHCGTLPQILVKCGIENYVFWRPADYHYELPQALFLWRGTDGTALKTYRLGGEGGSYFENGTLQKWCEKLPEVPHDLMIVYGVTDHGGAPTKAQIKEIRKLGETYPVTFSRVDDFFARQRKEDLPAVDGELLVNFIGPYNNDIEIKKNNRIAEYTLLNAEKACLLAKHLLGREYPMELLSSCWQDVLFNQFHDILGGTCIEAAYFDARNLHGRAIQSGSEQLHYALQAMTSQMKMPGKNPDNAWNLVLWNCNGFPVSEPIEAEVQWAWEFDWYEGGIELVDESGAMIPCQVIPEQCALPGFRSRFVFRPELDGLCCKSYIVRQTDQDSSKSNSPFTLSVSDGECTLYEGGALSAVSFLRPYAVFDECDTWGFNKTVWSEQKQYLRLRSFRCAQKGAVRTTYHSVWEFQNSSLELTYHCYSDRVDCRYRVLWNEKQYALKLELAIPGSEPVVTAATPYGSASRQACPWERPMGEWLSVENNTNALEISADSIFSYDFQKNAVGLTLLRNCIYGDLRAKPLSEAREYRYMGQGITEGRLAVWTKKSADLSERATAFQNPAVVLAEANHDGTLPGNQAFLQCTNPLVQITTLKEAEDGQGMILRFYNTTKLPQQAELTLFEEKTSVSFQPDEIQTLRFFDHQFTLCNMLEESAPTKG